MTPGCMSLAEGQGTCCLTNSFTNSSCLGGSCLLAPRVSLSIIVINCKRAIIDHDRGIFKMMSDFLMKLCWPRFIYGDGAFGGAERDAAFCGIP